jgi:hypothetical protein
MSSKVVGLMKPEGLQKIQPEVVLVDLQEKQNP